MLVRELIALLQNENPDATVTFADRPDRRWHTIARVRAPNPAECESTPTPHSFVMIDFDWTRDLSP